MQTESAMEIYLIKSGGQKEGPFSLAEINHQLAAKRYKDTDYWAWHSGLTEWVPLYDLPGVVSVDETAVWVLEERPAARPTAAQPETFADAASAAGGAVAPPHPPPPPRRKPFPAPPGAAGVVGPPPQAAGALARPAISPGPFAPPAE